MVSARKTLSIVLTVILVLSLSYGAMQYYSTVAFATEEETLPTEEAVLPVEEEVAPVESEEVLPPLEDTVAAEPEGPAPVEELEVVEELPYWQTDPVYQDLLNRLDGAAVAGAITNATMKILEGPSSAGISATIYVGQKEVLSNGTNAPGYDNYSGQLLTTREGLPSSGMTSDRSVLVLIEDRADATVYEATFLFGSNGYPDVPFTAFSTFVVIEKEVVAEEIVETKTVVVDEPQIETSAEEEVIEHKDPYAKYLSMFYNAYYSKQYDKYTMNANFTVASVSEDGTITGTVGSTSLTILGSSGAGVLLTDNKPSAGETSSAALLTYNGTNYDAIFLFGDMTEGSQEGSAVGGIQVTLDPSELAVTNTSAPNLGLARSSFMSLLSDSISTLSVNPNDLYVGQKITGYFTGNPMLWYNGQIPGGLFIMEFFWDDIYISCYMACTEPWIYGPESVSYAYAPVYLTITEINRATGYVYLDVWTTGPAAGYQDLSARNVPVQFYFTGDLHLLKESSSPSVTNGHPLYDLTGAQYGLYSSYANASSDTNRIHTFYVSSNAGATNPAYGLGMGTYYIKELKAGKGYKLDPSIYTVQLNSASATFTAKDSPVDDPTRLVVQKLDVETGEAYGKDDPNGFLLADGEFTIRYWDDYYDTIEDAEAAGPPTRTWIIKTEVNGHGYLSSECLAPGSDNLYMSSGGNPTLPLGCVAIQETTAPPGYLLPDPNPVSFQQIKETGDPLNPVTRLNTVIVEEEPRTVEVEKLETESETPVPNTEFTLYKESSVGADDWTALSTHVTDEFGKCVFSPVAPGSYKLDETRANPEYAELEESGDSAHYFTVTSDSTGEAQVFYNDLIQVSISVYKRTIPLTNTALDGSTDQVGNHVGKEEYLYHFGAKSNANVRVDEFVITDSLEYVTSKGYRMTTLWTGTAPEGMDYDGLMHLLYKTNMTDPSLPVSFNYDPMSANPINPNNPENNMFVSIEPGWVVWQECISTTTAIRLDVADLNLREGEYIIGIKAVYGGVVKGFYTGKSWENSDTAQSYTGDSETITTLADMSTFQEFELRDWSYAVVATGELLPIDEMGNETVMEASIRADLFRNWGGDAPVLADIAKDKVETRVIKPFKYDSEYLGIKPGGFFGGFSLPVTGDSPWLLLILLGIAITAGTSFIVAGHKKRRRPNEKG